MRIQKRPWPVLIAGTLLVAMTGTVLAFGPTGNCGDRKPMAAVYQLETLTDSQRAQLDALREQRRSAMLETRELRQSERQQLSNAVRSGDTATVRPLADKQGQRIADGIVRKAEMRQEIMAILTPEQQQELEKIVGRRGEKRGGSMRRTW